MSEQRTCLYCASALTQKEGEKPSQLAARVYCDVTCLRKHRAEAARRDGPRHCQHCNAELDRRHGESMWNFKSRKFCSNACRAAANKWKMPAAEQKTCAACGVQFSKSSKESVSQWAERIYCGRACHAHGRTIKKEKTCVCCGVAFSRTPGMSSAVWAKRRFCGAECSAKGRIKYGTDSEKKQADAERQKRARRQKMIADAIANAKPERPIARFQSVDEFLAAGGQIIRCPTVAVAPTAGIEIAERDRQIIAARYAANEAKFDNRPRVFG